MARSLSPMESSNLGQRHTKGIERRAFDGHEVVRTRQHFAVGMHFDPGRIVALHILLETGAESFEVFGKVAGSGLAADAPELGTKSTQIVSSFTPMVEARHVDVLATDAIVIAGWSAVKLRQESPDVKAHLFAQIFADDTRAITDPVWITARFGVQKYACGVDARSRQNDHFPESVMLFLGLAVEVLNAAGQSFSIGQYPGGYSIGAKCETARLESNRNEVVGRIEERRGIATTTAGTTVVAGSKSVVRAG